MYGSLKSGARKVRCIGFTDERGRNGEMRIWTTVGGIENKGEKSEVQGDLQIPSSLVALALPSLSSLPNFHSPFLRIALKSTYTKYTCIRMYVHVYSFAIVA